MLYFCCVYNKNSIMTDRIKGVVETFFAAIGVLGGFQFIKAVMNRKADRRKNDAEAYNAELEAIRKQYDWLQEKYDAINRKVDELYDHMHRLENENLELVRQKGELELALKESKFYECRRPDDECLKRLPEREICLAKKLLGGYYDKDDSGVADK